MSELSSVWVYSDRFDIALEILGKARELADKLQGELVSVLVGRDLQGIATEHIKHGADKILLADSNGFEGFQAEAHLEVLQNLVVKYRPSILIVSSTKNGKPLAARLATRLSVGCVPDCTRLSIDDQGRLVTERIAYGGNAVARVVLKTKPQIITVPARAFERPEPRERNGEIIRFDAEVEPARTQVIESRPLETSNVRIEDAQVIISCGRGLTRKEDKALLEELAEVLCGQVGCSRPLAEDRKWFSEWIGLSGHMVKPKLYIACGISGVIQHAAGIRDAKIVVAINKDEQAPIFEIADYAIVGDLYRILPAFKEAVQRKHK